MRFLIIIPAHNEQDYIKFCLESLQNQTHKDFELVVVNDGSTDKTKEIAEDFASKNRNFKLINLETSAHEPGAKVVRTFNKGLESLGLRGFDIICKFDADIVFPPDYLEIIGQVYRENPAAGMVSGIVKIKKSIFDINHVFDFTNSTHQWQFENISSKNHVRGPIKSYRKECFQQIGGLRPVLGWDNIDVMLAERQGWEVLTVKSLWVKHLRPTSYKYKHQKAEKLGEYFYNIGLNFPLAAISSLKSSLKNRSLSEFFVTMKSFCKQSHPRRLSPEEIAFIRGLRVKRMFRLFK